MYGCWARAYTLYAYRYLVQSGMERGVAWRGVPRLPSIGCKEAFFFFSLKERSKESITRTPKIHNHQDKLNFSLFFGEVF